MQVFVESSYGDDLTVFCNILILKIRSMVESRLNVKKLEVRDVIINNSIYNLIDWNGNKRIVESVSLYKQYLLNLRIRKKGEDIYIIESDPNVKIYGSNTTLDSIIRMIEYGKLGVPAYPLIRDVYQEIANNIPDYYKKWLEGAI